MSHSTHFSRALTKAIREHYGTKTAAGEAANLLPSTVSRHCRAEIDITDPMFAAYLQIFPRALSESLIRARLRDLIPPALHGTFFRYDKSTPLVQEITLADLPKEVTESLERFAEALSTDPELAEWWLATCRILRI